MWASSCFIPPKTDFESNGKLKMDQPDQYSSAALYRQVILAGYEVRHKDNTTSKLTINAIPVKLLLKLSLP